jgi:predicted aldo/keto reductase-like oxidoreductase
MSIEITKILQTNEGFSSQLGINYFDTSPFYGYTKSETVLGKCLKGIDRSKYYISTKVGRYGDTEFDFSQQRTIQSLNDVSFFSVIKWEMLCVETNSQCSFISYYTRA